MIVVKYDPVTNYVKDFQKSGEASADATTLIFHDQNTSSAVLTALYLLADTVPSLYMIVAGGIPREMTQAEKDIVNAAIAAADLLASKTGAKISIDGIGGYDKRALAKIMIDEINVLSQWLASFKVEVAAATNLADLKTRVAGLPATPDRTLAQAKTAYKNLIDGVGLDE
jgi:hypothetical protein